MSKTKKQATKRVSLPANAVVWTPGDPLPKALQQEVERQVEDFNRREEGWAGEQLTQFCGPKHANVTEVLFAVFGYLTTRAKPLIFSRQHDCAPIASLLGEIVRVNNLPQVREGGEQPKLSFPESLDDVGNTSYAELRTIYNVAQVYGIMLPLVHGLDRSEQNRLILTLIHELKRDREDELNDKTEALQEAKANFNELTNSISDLDRILNGQGQLVELVRPNLPNLGNDA